METIRLTADVVLLTNRPNGLHLAWHVLVIKRGWDPFEGCWALPGGHADDGEGSAAAAARELEEETGLKAPQLEQVGAYDTPGRDPRGRYVTVAYVAVVDGMREPTAGDDASDARWMPVTDLLADRTSLAFDHAEILTDAMRHVHFSH